MIHIIPNDKILGGKFQGRGKINFFNRNAAVPLVGKLCRNDIYDFLLNGGNENETYDQQVNRKKNSQHNKYDS